MPQAELEDLITDMRSRSVSCQVVSFIKKYVAENYDEELVPSHTDQPLLPLRDQVRSQFPGIFCGTEEDIEEMMDLVRLVAERSHFAARRRFRKKAEKENKKITRYYQGRGVRNEPRPPSKRLHPSLLRGAIVDIPLPRHVPTSQPFLRSQTTTFVKPNKEPKGPAATKTVHITAKSPPPSGFAHSNPRVSPAVFNDPPPAGFLLPCATSSMSSPTAPLSNPTRPDARIGLASYPDLVTLSELTNRLLDSYIFALIDVGLHSRAVLEQWACFPNLDAELLALYQRPEVYANPSLAEIVILRRALVAGFNPGP
ncbi:hypothetical protein CPB83DRAFT_900440 [Crepidotus variabilis]|uniref:Uncharacterized protein n=1 Tax=Crepidotus variabilis TaxID=179855 RepID=A0A9P6E357_9AGAR|nr:hypothetical protein CPB83DRAFT_900440 [Crepidotus variabilis]